MPTVLLLAGFTIIRQVTHNRKGKRGEKKANSTLLKVYPTVYSAVSKWKEF